MVSAEESLERKGKLHADRAALVLVGQGCAIMNTLCKRITLHSGSHFLYPRNLELLIESGNFPTSSTSKKLVLHHIDPVGILKCWFRNPVSAIDVPPTLGDQ